MKKKAMKYGLMTIAAVLLVAIAFAGAASAEIINIKDATEWQNNISHFEAMGFGDIINLTGNIDFGGDSENVMVTWISAGGESPNLEGNDYTISNFSISGSKFIGLFGYYDGNKIANVTLSNFSVSGDYCVGGLVGFANSPIHFENVHVEYGNVSVSYNASITMNDFHAGGLVGIAYSTSWINKSSAERMSVSASGGRNIVAGLVGSGFSTSISDSWVNLSEITALDSSRVAGLIGYGGDNANFKNLSVMNCTIAGRSNVGGLLGFAWSASLKNIRAMNCTIAGCENVGGLAGYSGTVGWSSNTVENCAVNRTSGTSTMVNLVCGNRPELENPNNCTVTGNNYIRNQSAEIPQPWISILKGTDKPSSDMKTAITVTKLSGIGTKNNLQYACGYVIDSSLLEFNPLNGTDTYSTIIKVGAKDTFAVPADAGYIFNGWNISSSSGMNLTNAAGELLSGVTGYTNATGYWNNVSGITVELYANRTAIEYNKSVPSSGIVEFGNSLPVAQVNVGSANPNITSVSFEFMGAPAEIATKPSGYKSIATINDAFNLSITGTQDADVTIVFNATGSGTIFLAHNKTGNWEFLKATATGVAGQYKAIVTKESGFSPFQIISAVANDPVYTPSSSKQTGSTIILSEGQVAPTASATAEPTVAPTAEPTPATPTVIATAKPTTQATQQSPAPFLGILAGLGAAAVLLRLRK